jgi:hypothetical protein
MELILVCGSAFLWVFLILCALALLMHLIMRIFPQAEQGMDPSLVAALTTVIPFVLPGTQVTKIEEKK